MSNLFSGIGNRFRGSGKNGGSKSPGPGQQSASPTSPTSGYHTSQNSSSSNLVAPRVPPLPSSPSLSQSLSLEPQSGDQTPDILAHYNLPRPKPLWLNVNYAQHIVKGNFMTLSARPKTVEPGEWIAHQVVEHQRLLWHFVQVICSKDEEGRSICNAKTCPRMSAAPNITFTWLNTRKEPTELPACEYIALMKRWLEGKTDNPAIFPTDPAGVSFAHSTSTPNINQANFPSGGLNTPGAESPIPAGPTTLNASLSSLAGPGDWVGKSSGFPVDFFDTCQQMFRQMFRVYAHLYWAHFVDPYYHVNLEKAMNSCFSHFILTATGIDMLQPHELEAMQPLIDLWAANGTFPKESKAYACANIKAGERLMALATGGN